jgi:hypothetical protein
MRLFTIHTARHLLGLCALALAAGCAVRPYQTMSLPMSVVQEEQNTITLGAGVPFGLQYQHRFGGRIELLTAGGYLRSTSSDTLETDSGDVTTEETAHLIPVSLGIRYWITDPSGPNGFDFGVFAGGESAFNHDSDWWYLGGAHVGFSIGAHAGHFGFAIPLSVGGGWTDGGRYVHVGGEVQMMARWRHIGFGGRLGVIYGPGTMSDALLVHVPINMGVFVSSSF